jgi:hypothetical protein
MLGCGLGVRLDDVNQLDDGSQVYAFSGEMTMEKLHQE